MAKRNNVIVSIIFTLIAFFGGWVYFKLTNQIDFDQVQYQYYSSEESYDSIDKKQVMNKQKLTLEQLQVIQLLNNPNDIFHNGQYLYATFDNSVAKILIDGQVQELILTQKGINQALVISYNGKYAYFYNTELGICQLNLKSLNMKILKNYFKGIKFTQILAMTINKEGSQIYFTQSSSLVTQLKWNVYKEIALGNPLGKAFKYNIETEVLSLIADQLYFPWGIVLQQNDKSVLISEASRHRIIRVSLTEFNKKKTILKNLQGFPAGLSINKKDKLWIAFYDIRGYGSDFVDSYAFMKYMIINLPSAFTEEAYYGSKVCGGIEIDLNNQSNKKGAQIQNLLFLKAGDKGYFWNNFWRNKLKRTNKIIQKDENIYMSSWRYPQIFKINKQLHFKNKKIYHGTQYEQKQQF